MTRFIRNGSPITTEIPSIQLLITGSHGNYRGRYSSNLVLVGDGKTTIEIELLNETTDGTTAFITDYSSTGVSAKDSPIKAFEPSEDGQSALMTIGLYPHQLIDFGVFVELRYGKQPPTLMFCDPQASNDPIKNP